ncbi:MULTISPECIES: helix-turn-helix domain-containing protein [Rhodococcus]|uniref:Helix-turn-helix domain-containing protein n=1 Tax=Rhodococcus qingshengii JCM 15477 TaxID=1303681 RepID=A0AB38R706_RHOSG|nr:MULTISPECIES: helix-turn-helix domain-containing protein [Rhodococcus]UPU40540.1 helix-turn-helix domain-containing protein [Rhodococcus qingshengii JCM 15477]
MTPAAFITGVVALDPRAAALVAKAIRTGNEQLRAHGAPGFTRDVLAAGVALEKASRAGANAINTSAATTPNDGLVQDAERLTTEQAANLLGVTPNAVRDLARRGRLDGHKIGQNWTFDPWQIEARKRHQRQGNS